MYLPRSFYSDIGDVEVIEHQGILHMFHLVLPNRDLVAHAISTDGLSWTAVGPALVTGNPGACDDDMIRTVSVTYHENRFYMLYTATSRAEAGKAERIALATSTDLYKWEKQQGGAVACADPRFYEAEISHNRGQAFRDAKPYAENGVFYAVVCARANEGPRFRRGCAALMTSTDMQTWTPQAPLLVPGLYDELECPQIYKIGAYYYLFASVIEERAQRYWISKELMGPYLTPVNGILFPPGSHYAGRVTSFGGKDIFACWTPCQQDGPHPYGLREILGESIRYVPAILELCQHTDGTLRLQSTHAWEHYLCEPAAPGLWSFTLGSTQAALSTQGESSRITSPEGFAIFLSKNTFSNFTWQGNLCVEGTEAGLAFGADAEAGGYYVKFSPGLHRVTLLKHVTDPVRDRFCYQILQEAHADFSTGQNLSFLLRYVGGEIEFSLDGVLVFSTVSTARMSGQLGLYATCAQASFSGMRIFPMTVPNNK